MIVVVKPKIIQRLLYRGRVADDDERHHLHLHDDEEEELSAGASGASVEQTRSEPTDGTLALLYDEIGSALQAQHDYVESLNARAQQLLGFATIILAIVAAIVPTHPSVGIRVLYAIALPVFALAAVFSGLAWRIRGYRFDPKPLSLWDHYRLEDERHVREKVIANRRQSLAHNDEELERKLRFVKWADKSLLLGFFYVAIVLLYQVAHG